jgi:phosphoglycerate dehydrogenase-like enzyme
MDRKGIILMTIPQNGGGRVRQDRREFAPAGNKTIGDGDVPGIATEWPEAEKLLSDASGGMRIVMTGSRPKMETLLDEVEVVIGDVPPVYFSKMPNLKWVQLWSAGADQLFKVPGIADLKITVTTTSGLHRYSLSEHVFALILAWSRRLPIAFAAQERGEWKQVGRDSLVGLDGKEMVILGYGKIGEQVGTVAKALGMKVTGVRRHDGEAALTAALPRADYLVNILPSTPATKTLLNAEKFAALKDGCVYVNIGRGATTDEAALVEALQSGKLGAALLDVFQEEPLPPASPLWEMDNVIITAHYGGFTARYNEIALDIALDNMKRWVSGQPLRNVVDMALGY